MPADARRPHDAIPAIGQTGARRRRGGRARRAPPRGHRTARWLVAAAAVLVLAGAGWCVRGRLVGRRNGPTARPTGRRSRSPCCRSATRPAIPTLDSLGSSLSQVLAHRARRVVARPHRAVGAAAPGASRSADRPERDAAPAGARARRRLHERAARALGPVRRDSASRSASTRRCRISTAGRRAAQRDGGQRERACSPRSAQLAESVRAEPRARLVRHARAS